MWWLVGGFVVAASGLGAIIGRRGGAMDGFDHNDKGAQFQRQVLERIRLRRSRRD
ncbi:hypothetical protein [Janibacter limosus]|jgi:hypothetical protein|uniref:hypothetical protein n=1 Tax=Janibacter limosus TaxID=53458 RepID=UPI0013EEBD2A|nr:hypothetical protein [Janibacter limosus]